MSAKNGYTVSEVVGRRFPWRVHARQDDPRFRAEGCFATEAEARAACAEANRAPRTLNIRVPGLSDLGRRLGRKL